jgi:hypothetical protein
MEARMSLSLQPTVTEPQNTANAADLPTYRCATRPYQQACEMDPTLDSFIQLKARDASDAITKARLVADRDTIVMGAERLDR